MTSILTNTSAMSALQTLRSIGNNMEDTQSRISSGLKVGSASDNAAYWSIATTMRSDNDALGAVSDALGLGAAKVDTAYSGMESAIEVVKQIKNKLTAATEDGIDKSKVQEEITQLQDQLKSIAQAASFSGENWLQADVTTTTSQTKSVVGSFIRDASGNVSVKKIDYTLDSNSVLIDSGAAAGAYGNGILNSEALFSGTDGVTVKVSVNGVSSDKAVKGYTSEDLMSQGLTFQTTADGQNIASDTAGPTPQYIKLKDQDIWVQLTATAPTTGQDIAYDDGAGAQYYINTANAPTAVTNANAGFSVTDLNITDLATVAGAMGTGFTESDALAFMIDFVDKKLTAMTSTAADLGSVKMRIDLQSDFVSKLTDSLDKGVGRLVDADMNEESTRLKALQTQQQLAIQALSIANSDSQNIMTLFR